MVQDNDVVIGLIGMGDMGRMYANRLAKDPERRLLICDRPERFESLKLEFKDRTNITVMQNGHLVSRASDFIIYSVDAEFLDGVVEQYGPSTKTGAIVAAQTSVKTPERIAFEKYLPSDVKICSVHSLHGPSISPDGEALVLVPHRCTNEDKELVKRLLSPMKSRYVELSYDEHDEVTANTQACTHAAFLSMGTAWHAVGSFPWEMGRYIRGIEVVKINIALRIYSAKWHVYAGLAILNPSAKIQIDQYARSVTELFTLMISNREDLLRKRVLIARDFVFGIPNSNDDLRCKPLFPSDDFFKSFAIGEPAEDESSPPNSHLTLLGIVDCWYQLKINPLKHLELAATPVFKMWFGLIQFLFLNPERLESTISASIKDLSYRGDDCEFVLAARGWSQCISHGDFQVYRRRFEHTAEFFSPMFEEGKGKISEMLKFALKSEADLKKTVTDK
ncbi:hypothetical protein CROQUDRAFT_656752 [Cronartium quercuum f. sp. fusiforme G11]|uniref:Prephenate/arogenate dehydrogenase domain-containing protein n=1 Tax=Cronartium quercuum f. sp. fusiforme G11 TaxID=708437 RepID=A0A9P6NMP4_9BASI|nr:hypothetical protein CROQUDRAFT_656752 [Cronartium quercuum f. sp. fusiforme G11]